jgi:hypothetical protein
MQLTRCEGVSIGLYLDSQTAEGFRRDSRYLVSEPLSSPRAGTIVLQKRQVTGR